MTYTAFKNDVLEHGAMFACNFAHSVGVTGRVQAIWLARITAKFHKVAA